MTLKVLELFGGIGACTCALKRMGIDIEIVDYVEIDKYAVASYNAVNGTKFEPQDIKKWNKDIEVDFCLHGSPCQDFSLAGLQKGGDEGSGTRSSLMYETLRIVKKLKPKYVVWENVANLISQTHFHNFANYLNAMADMGYANAYKVLNSKNYGIPQNRERVFTISVLNGRTTDLLGETLDFTFPKEITLNLLLKDMIEENVPDKYYLSEKMMKYIESCKHSKHIFNKHLDETLEHNEVPDGVSYIDAYNRSINKDNITGTISTRVNENNDCFIAIKNATKKGYLEAKAGDGIDISPRMETHRGTVQKGLSQTLTSNGPNVGVVCACDIRYDEGLRMRTEENISVCIGTQERGGYSGKPLIVEKNNIDYAGTFQFGKSDKFMEGNSRYKPTKNISDTILKAPKEGVVLKDKIKVIGNYSPSGHNASTIVSENSITPCVRENHGTITATIDRHLRIRKLTSKECWRLMGQATLKENGTWDDTNYLKAATVCSESQLYKQAGNSIVVNVLEHLFRELFRQYPYE